MLDGKKSGRTSGRDTDLGVDVLDVMVRRLGRDDEPVGGLLGGKAEGQQSEHFGLAGGQPRGERRPGGASVTCGGEDPLDGLAVEAPCCAHRPQFGRNVLVRMCVTIRADRGHGLVTVRGGDDALGLIEMGSADAPVVAGAVDALVGGARGAGQCGGVGHTAPASAVV